MTHEDWYTIKQCNQTKLTLPKEKTEILKTFYNTHTHTHTHALVDIFIFITFLLVTPHICHLIQFVFTVGEYETVYSISLLKLSIPQTLWSRGPIFKWITEVWILILPSLWWATRLKLKSPIALLYVSWKIFTVVLPLIFIPSISTYKYISA